MWLLWSSIEYGKRIRQAWCKDDATTTGLAKHVTYGAARLKAPQPTWAHGNAAIKPSESLPVRSLKLPAIAASVIPMRARACNISTVDASPVAIVAATPASAPSISTRANPEARSLSASANASYSNAVRVGALSSLGRRRS
jgi:hypothetical protein